MIGLSTRKLLVNSLSQSRVDVLLTSTVELHVPLKKMLRLNCIVAQLVPQ